MSVSLSDTAAGQVGDCPVNWGITGLGAHCFTETEKEKLLETVRNYFSQRQRNYFKDNHKVPPMQGT